MKNKSTFFANAKINIHLEVVGKRENGYHDISSVFQSVTLNDRLDIALNSSGEVSVLCEGAEIVGENLAKLAAERFLGRAGLELGAEITLKKNIPLSAGLGGGSADAAAVLYGLNTMTDFPLEKDDLSEIALSLGADVPFCLFGGTKRAEGLGERLTDIAVKDECFVILIKQHKKQSTGQMYNLVDSLEKGEAVTERVVNALEGDDKIALKKYCRNDFLAISDDKAELEKIISNLYESGAFLAGLSGSGPTVFALFENEPRKETVSELKNLYKEVYLCKTADCGVETE